MPVILRKIPEMICLKCGSSNSEDALYCLQCGTSIPNDSDSKARPKEVDGKFSIDTEGNANSTDFTVADEPGVSAANPAANVEPGCDFGVRYRIEAVLGEGGMGKVLKAWDRELSRNVALKLIRPELASDPNSLRRFKKELLLARQISHKNILRIHDLGDNAGTKFISMAFIEGQDLHALLATKRKLPLERALHIARQMCAALEAAHNEGVIHRDLKPQNIMIDGNDNVYVTDFGLAKSLVSDLSDTTQSVLTKSGEILGTPRYMAPEQVIAQPVDHRSDIYSFGLIFYEMVAGETPFAGRSMVEVMYQRVKERPRNPQTLAPDLPTPVAQIILRCLEKDPEKRYQNAKEILADLDSLRANELSPKPLIPRLSRRLWILICCAALLVALILAAPSLWNAARRLLTESGDRQSVQPATAPKYIAILPFRILGADESLKYVADGVVESLSAKFFQLKDVRLASASAVEKADLNKPGEEIARTLGVRLLIRGTLQGSGQGFRVTVSADDMSTRQLIFNQDFSGLVTDLLTIEDNIFNRLSSALSLNLSNEEQAQGALHPTENIEAYRLYLQGLSVSRNKLDVKSQEKAWNFYNQAVEKDPDFALAYTGIADTGRLIWNQKKDPIWIRKAQGAAEQAKRLNDLLPEVHYSLGGIYQATGKTSEAIVELKRAQELAPGTDEGYRRLASAYIDAGLHQEAISAYKKAVEANPYYWLNYNELGAAYLIVGMNGEAVEAFRSATKIDPSIETAYINLGICYYRQGKWTECIEAFRKAIQIKPSYDAYTNLGTAYFYLKRYREAADVFLKAVDIQPNDYLAVANLADAYRCLGEKEKADRAYSNAIGLALQYLKVNPRHAGTLGLLAVCYAKKQDHGKALQFIRSARAIDKNDNSLMYNEAIVNTLAGRNAEALKNLRDAFRNGYPPEEAQNDPELRSLESDPGYASLLNEYRRSSR